MDPSSVRDILLERREAVERRLTAACERVGRPRSSVNLVAVTKTLDEQYLSLLPDIGLKELGENRPQQLWSRAALLSQGVHWHLVGHLQRNKVERTLPLVEWIHSVDSLRLLQAIEEAASASSRTVNVLLEVNTSGEAQKHGFSPDELPTLIPALGRLNHIKIGGLMTMAAVAEDPEESRPCFALLRRLGDQLREVGGERHSIRELSMGMTNDFEVAIEEGATMVRIGSALFADLV